MILYVNCPEYLERESLHRAKTIMSVAQLISGMFLGDDLLDVLKTRFYIVLLEIRSICMRFLCTLQQK